MTKRKIAVSLPPELIEAARQAVEDGRVSSVSAYVAEALARQQRIDTLAELLEEMIAEHGEPSEEEYGWARRALGLA